MNLSHKTFGAFAASVSGLLSQKSSFKCDISNISEIISPSNATLNIEGPEYTSGIIQRQSVLDTDILSLFRTIESDQSKFVYRNQKTRTRNKIVSRRIGAKGYTLHTASDAARTVAIDDMGLLTFTGAKPAFITDDTIGVGSAIVSGDIEYTITAVVGTTNANAMVSVTPVPAMDIATAQYELYALTVGAGEATLEYEKKELDFSSIPGVLPVDLEIIEDESMMKQLLEFDLRSIVRQYLGEQLVEGDGKFGRILGLLNVTGIATKTAAATTNVKIGALDLIASAYEDVLTKTGRNPTGIILRPGLFSDIVIAALSNARELTPGLVGYVNGRLHIHGLPVAFSSKVPATLYGIVGDFSQALVPYRKNGEIAVSTSHDDSFNELMVMIRIWTRATLGVLNTDSIVKFGPT